MSENDIYKKYLPLTEATYYILLSLTEPMHGYGIMQNVKELSSERLNIGPGTLYGVINKLLKEDLIIPYISNGESSRRKSYIITDLGRSVIQLEFKRLNELVSNGDKILTKGGL